MGLLDFIPGGSAAKNAASGVAGLSLGSLLGYCTGKYLNNKELEMLQQEYATLEDEVNALRSRLGVIDPERQARAILRVAVLRQLAWRDKKIHDAEKLYLHDYILNNPDLQEDVKVQLIKEVSDSPTTIEGFWKAISKDYKKQLCTGIEEAHGFKTILMQLANIDGSFSKSEEGYINDVLGACGVAD